jgi:AAA family ATPase
MSITLQVVAASQDIATASTRNIRRAYISPDTLRTHKLIAGEWVRLSSNSEGNAVVQLWPQAGITDNGMCPLLMVVDISGLLLDTVHQLCIAEGSVQVSRFENSHCRGIAKTVTLKGEPRAGREALWLEASVKETLCEFTTGSD